MRKVVVFSGAGLSADSGIQTFRGADGLWENHKVEDVAEHEAWFRDRELVLKFYAERYEKYKDCKPHEGHFAIASLQDKYEVINITQNIDDLLEQAGCKTVIHLHGKMKSKKCEWHTDIATTKATRTFSCDYRTEATESVKMGDLCPKCGGQMRPDVVWFNEAVHAMNYDDMANWVRDVKYEYGFFICVGTSVQVYPAGYFVSFFSQVKNKYIVDPNPQKVADYQLLKGNAKTVLPLLADHILSMEG